MQRRQFLTMLGGASAWPVAARAQGAGKVVRIGFLATGTLESADAQTGAGVLRQAMRDLGYVDGRDFVLVERSAHGRIEELAGLARELVALKVDIIVAGATPAGRAARQATSTIPIVVSSMGDPVRDKLVDSLAAPGGNLTGTTFLGPELVPKRLGLLRELLPRATRVAALWHPEAFSERTMAEMLKETTDAAASLGLELRVLEVHRPDDIDRAFAAAAQDHVNAVFQLPSTMLFSERKRMVANAAKTGLATMFNAREFVELGGLIAYGANITELNRRVATYVDRIIKGAKPAELPVELPTKFELSINLTTAKALGVEVPLFLQQRADFVID